MNDPHTKFPPALCTTFANLIVLFASPDSRGLFTLWTDVTTAGPKTDVKPSRLQETGSPLGHPRCCTWAGEVPLRTRPFQHLPAGNSFRVSVFGRTEAIKRYSSALAQDPHKGALLPTLAGKTLVCHCLAHEECHVDALVQTYESEVIIYSEAFTPATLQRNDASLVTEPHCFSRSADGGGVHSSGDWLAPRAGTSNVFKDFRHAIVEIVSKHGLHNAARAAWAARSRSPFMRDKHTDDLLAGDKIFSAVSRITPRSVRSHQNQPFLLGLLRNLFAAHAGPRHGPHRHGPSQGSTRVCSNQYGSLVFGAADRPKREMTCRGKSTTQPKKTRTPCLGSPKRTSTPTSFRSCTVTSLEPKKRWPRRVAVGRLSVARSDPAPLLGQHDTERQRESSD